MPQHLPNCKTINKPQEHRQLLLLVSLRTDSLNWAVSDEKVISLTFHVFPDYNEPINQYNYNNNTNTKLANLNKSKGKYVGIIVFSIP